jgi:glucosylceramidase
MIKLLNHPKRANDSCLVIRELRNNGGAFGPRGGAQVTVGRCDEESAKWFTDKETGMASSFYFAEGDVRNEVCITTGWPFLQMGAFSTPNGDASNAIVVLNEANDAANYAIRNSHMVVMTASIPPRSIQTILLNDM